MFNQKAKDKDRSKSALSPRQQFKNEASKEEKKDRETQISIRNLAPPPKEKKSKKKDRRNKKAAEEKKSDELKIDMGTLAVASQGMPKKYKAKKQDLDDSNIL